MSTRVQKRYVTRTDRFQNQMVVTGDSFLGVRFLSAESARMIGVRRCLYRTVRSHGFSPSQRFSPIRASWLCFTPHPPIGFRSSELFPPAPAVVPLSTRCSLVVSPAFGSDRLPGCSSSLLPSIVRLAHLRWGAVPGSRCAPLGCARHQPNQITRLASSARRQRAARAIQRVDARLSPSSPLTLNG